MEAPIGVLHSISTTSSKPSSTTNITMYKSPGSYKAMSSKYRDNSKKGGPTSDNPSSVESQSKKYHSNSKYMYKMKSSASYRHTLPITNSTSPYLSRKSHAKQKTINLPLEYISNKKPKNLAHL